MKNQTMLYSHRANVSGYTSSRNQSHVDSKNKTMTKSSNRVKPSYKMTNLSMKKLSMIAKTS